MKREIIHLVLFIIVLMAISLGGYVAIILCIRLYPDRLPLLLIAIAPVIFAVLIQHFKTSMKQIRRLHCYICDTKATTYCHFCSLGLCDAHNEMPDRRRGCCDDCMNELQP